jgi:hypothetical protein
VHTFGVRKLGRSCFDARLFLRQGLVISVSGPGVRVGKANVHSFNVGKGVDVTGAERFEKVALKLLVEVAVGGGLGTSGRLKSPMSMDGTEADVGVPLVFSRET